MTRQSTDEKRWGDTLTLQGGQMGGLLISPPSKTIISFSISSLVRRYSKMCGGGTISWSKRCCFFNFLLRQRLWRCMTTRLFLCSGGIRCATAPDWVRSEQFAVEPKVWMNIGIQGAASLRGGIQWFLMRPWQLSPDKVRREHYRSHWKSMYQDWRQYHYCSYGRTNATISSRRWWRGRECEWVLLFSL